MRLISYLVILYGGLCIIILGFILTLLSILLIYLARLFTVLICESVVSINLIFIVDCSVIHVLVLVAGHLAIVMRLFSFNKFSVECIDNSFSVLMKHQVVDILLAHRRVILINQYFELWIFHKLQRIKPIRVDLRIILSYPLLVSKVSLVLSMN